MKITFLFSVLILFFTSCHKDPYYESETDQKYSILKKELTSLTNVPINFYLIQGNINSPLYVTSCLNTEIKFEKPYLIANGIKFNIYNWGSSQHMTDSTGRNTSHMVLIFYPEN